MKKRREILEVAGLGSAALMTALAMAPGEARAEILAAAPQGAPRHHIRFAVCGISHDHIHGMIGAIQRGGGELVSYWGAEPDKLAVFARRFANAKAARSQDEVLHDPFGGNERIVRHLLRDVHRRGRHAARLEGSHPFRD